MMPAPSTADALVPTAFWDARLASHKPRPALAIDPVKTTPTNPPAPRKSPPDDAAILASMSKPRPSAPVKAEAIPFKVFTADEIAAQPSPEMRIKKILPRTGFGVIGGVSGTGKSTYKDELGRTLSDGGDFFGHSVVEPCDVLSYVLEGQSGLRNRQKAIRTHFGEQAGRRHWFVTEPLSLLYAEDVDRMVATAKAIGIKDGVIFLDTLNAASPGANENESGDMGKMIAALKRIQSECGGLVIALHHLGKDTSRGLRGHSSLFAALDFVIEVSRDGDRRSWKLAKSKDGEDGIEHPFRLQVVEVGKDEDGDPITSCVVVPDESAKSATRSRLPKGGNQRIVYDALGELLRNARHFGQGGAPASRPCVELEAAVAAIAPRLAVDEKRKVERTRQAITGLIATKAIVHREGWVWLP